MSPNRFHKLIWSLMPLDGCKRFDVLNDPITRECFA